MISVFCLPALAQGQDQIRSKFEGFYTDLGIGYRNINTSTTSVLTLNSSVIPSSVSSGGPGHTVAVMTTGYNFQVAQNYFIAIGANISPANGLTQELQIQALNKTTTVSGIKSLYNYGFFLSPGFKTEHGLVYLKVGKQTQVNNSNTGPNFNGNLLGLGYKQFIYGSIYFFGEASYSSYGAQTTSRSIVSSGRTFNASVTTTPQTNRFLVGLGYQF
ncbi:hypothetical protein [Polynucleobacter arcticus]|uniref:hypothetical protein n=1 Tax=Polynucleobacter arcticus TaxID=1743165 RepID=UPI00157003B0|nr:hypothetical protein [Polynucleobacter arcticus]